MASELSFETVWENSRKIHGAFTEVDARRMYKVAMQLPAYSQIVEVGTFWGRSASLLGQVAMHRRCQLTCVDSYVNVPEGSPYGKKGCGVDHVMGNLHKLGIHVTMMMMPSEVAARRYLGYIDLLFVDADHGLKGARLDCKLWLPKLRSGGYALFHDYASSDPCLDRKGVKKAVRELRGFEMVEAPVPGGTMAILRKE